MQQVSSKKNRNDKQAYIYNQKETTDISQTDGEERGPGESNTHWAYFEIKRSWEKKVSNINEFV